MVGRRTAKKPKKPALPVRWQKFVEAYEGPGSGVDACRAAGFRGTAAALAVQSCRLLRDARVREALAVRDEGALEKLILTREERQERWSEIALDPATPIGEQLKALDALGNSQGDFTKKLEVKGELTLAALVRESTGQKP